MALCQREIMRKRFAVGEKGARPRSGEGLGAGAAVPLRGSGAAREGPAAGLGWAAGNSRKPKRV